MIILDEATSLPALKRFSEIRDIFDLPSTSVVLVETDRLDAQVGMSRHNRSWRVIDFTCLIVAARKYFTTANFGKNMC